MRRFREKVCGGYEQDASSESALNPDTLTVSVKIGGSRSARYAAPSADQNFIYAALIYSDGASPAAPAADEFSMGTLDESAGGSTINFMFQKPVQTSGLTVEVFAFKENTAEADFERTDALLSGSKNGLSVNANNTITIGEITLRPNAADTAPKGTVSLLVKVPFGCALEIDDTTNFALTGTSSDFTIEHSGDGISAGSYNVAFKVTKNSKTLYMFSDSITVFPGMLTDTWGGLAAGEALEITAQNISRTFYVRGSGRRYDGSPYDATATASDDNPGSFLAPFATIQKAIDTVLAANDSSSEYTIFVDGTLTYDGSSTYGMANFYFHTSRSLTLTIRPVSATEKSTDANGLSRVVCAQIYGGNIIIKLDLTLERLVLTGGMTTGAGGGIYLTGIRYTTRTIKAINCDIIGNTAINGGGVYVDVNSTFTMVDGTVSDNTVNSSGGGVYVAESSKFEMTSGEISGNTCRSSGGGVYVYNGGALSMSENATISNNSAKNGKGACLSASSSAVPTLSMSGAAYFDPDDDVYLKIYDSNIPTIQVDGALTQDKVATITPSSYAKGTQVLSASSGVTMTQDICDQFALTPNPDKTEWEIALDSANNAGMLKRVEISGGIEIVIPGLETYTFTVDVGGALTEGATLTAGQTVTLSNVVDSKGRTPSGSLKMAIRDTAGNEFSSATATGDSAPLSVTLPVVPPGVGISAQVYLELTDDGFVINKTIDVTISN